jgi:hypothetical protein
MIASTPSSIPIRDRQFGTVNVVVRQRDGAMTVVQEPTPPTLGELERIVEGEG